MKTQLHQSLKIGDKVIFDKDSIEIFKSETSSSEKSVKQYQQLVLKGINQVGSVLDIDDNLTIVSYSDGWELPIPTKYLILMAKLEN